MTMNELISSEEIINNHLRLIKPASKKLIKSNIIWQIIAQLTATIKKSRKKSVIGWNKDCE